jgi:hypothetical protein
VKLTTDFDEKISKKLKKLKYLTMNFIGLAASGLAY